MTLDEKFIPVRTAFYDIVEKFFKKIAGIFGYPDSPGLSSNQYLDADEYNRLEFIKKLPSHETNWPPPQQPETWFEMIFGTAPKVDGVPRYIYENKSEGFYNFYIKNYKNIYFLPDWLSEWIQVKLDICLDITPLEIAREVIFLGFIIYAQIVLIRITISWFIYINPYTYPWCFLVAGVDWTEDALQGIIPSIFGVNITGSVVLGALGAFGDSVNHVVFTMPFLPSEAEEKKLLINETMTDVLVYHYLPILWYRYTIPNDIREFWYKERPEILEYMQQAYKDIDIQILPDSVISDFSQKVLVTDFFFDSTNLINVNTSVNQLLSTELFSKINLIQTNLFFLSRSFDIKYLHSFTMIPFEEFF